MATDLFLSLYLYARSILLLNGNSANVVNLCAAAFKTDCDATLLSEEAVIMEMPLAGWGLVYFGGLATLSEIARRQGKFWPFHDAVHARDRLPDRDALALGVEGTPTVFVSGRRALNPSKKTMNMLMWHQIGLELEQA